MHGKRLVWRKRPETNFMEDERTGLVIWKIYSRLVIPKGE